MDQRDILQIITRQLLNQRNHLDILAQTSGFTEDAKCAYDRASGLQRDNEMAELEPLMNAEDQDIHAALVQLGPSLAVEYLQFRAGSRQLAGHRPLYAACVKLGHPAISWEEARLQARQVTGISLKNPQGPIFSGLQKSGVADFETWKRQGEDAGSLPYLSDRFYLNGVIRNLQKGDPLKYEDNNGMSDSLRLSRMLFDAAIEGWEEIKDQPHLVDEDLRLCALVTFACQELPGYSDFEDGWHSEGASPVLAHLDKAIEVLERISESFNAATSCAADKKEIFAAFDASQIGDARILRQRVEPYAHTELFSNPVTHAHRLYDYLEAEKLTRLLKPALTSDRVGAPPKTLDHF